MIFNSATKFSGTIWRFFLEFQKEGESRRPMVEKHYDKILEAWKQLEFKNMLSAEGEWKLTAIFSN